MPLHEGDPSSSSPENPISPISPLYSDVFPFENDYFSTVSDWTVVGDIVGNIYGTESQMPDLPLAQPSISSEIPWTPQVAFHTNPDTGCVAFAPPPGFPHGTYIARQEYLDRGQIIEDIFSPGPVSPVWKNSAGIVPAPVSPVWEDSGSIGQAHVSPLWEESGDEGWQQVAIPSYANSTIPSHSSPCSEGSPFSLINSPPQTSSPPAHRAESHSHIFTIYPGIEKPKPLRGRQRGLTAQEKKNAREVREAKACWACHLSKIKVGIVIIFPVLCERVPNGNSALRVLLARLVSTARD